MQNFVPLKAAGQITPVQPAVRALWQTGALLRAMVIDTSAAGRVQLQIGRQAVDARTTLPLRTGDTINLRVGHSGELTVLRKIDDASSMPRTNGADPRGAPVTSALRSALPRQQSLTPLLANLQQVAANTDAGYPARVVSLAQAFVEQLPSAQKLAGLGGLSDWLALSGLTNEARAAAGRPPPTGDLKNALLRLAAALTSQTSAASNKAPPAGVRMAAGDTLPPLHEGAVQPQPRVAPTVDAGANPTAHLLRDVDAALARIQLSQLASLPVDDSGRQVWMFELALRNRETVPDLVQFRIEKEPQRKAADGSEQDPRWTVEVALDLDELGAVEARVSLLGQSVSASFRTARAGTGELIKSRLNALRTTLDERGLILDRVTCGPCRADKSLRLQTRLIEETA